MTQGRKPAPKVEVEIIDAAGEQHVEHAIAVARQDATAQALAASQHDAAVRAVAVQIGYQLPADCTDPDLIQRDISANMRRSVEACLEVGRGLCVLRTACEHGNFLARLDVMGIEKRVAQRFMSSARKFSNAATSPLLRAVGTQSKLFELLVLDDDQIEELELTGQTGELSLDDVATMSVKDLRAKVRDLKADLQATRELSSEKSDEIERLKEERIRIKKQPPDDVRIELEKETAEIVGEARNGFTSVRGAFTALAQHYIEHGGTDIRHLMAGHVGELQRLLNALREDFNLRDVEGDGTPEWMTWAGPDAAAATR